MTHTNNLPAQPIHSASLNKRMLQGAVPALILIIIFLLGVKNPDPAWGSLWMLKPLIIVPLAGSGGGVFYYLMEHLSSQGGWRKTLAILLSVFAYVVALWLGSVLGLNGTLWN